MSCQGPQAGCPGQAACMICLCQCPCSCVHGIVGRVRTRRLQLDDATHTGPRGVPGDRAPRFREHKGGFPSLGTAICSMSAIVHPKTAAHLRHKATASANRGTASGKQRQMQMEATTPP
eukprot:3434640-Rhodomonas_salina.1